MNLKEMCKSLRLAYVSEIYESIPMKSSETFLTTLFEMGMRLREEAKAERLIKKQNSSTINHLKTIIGITPSTFLDHQQNVVLTGVPGTGKGYSTGS